MSALKHLFGFLEKISLYVRKWIAKKQGKSYIRVGKCNKCGFCCTMLTLCIEGKPITKEEEFEHLKEVFPEYTRFYIIGRDEDGHLLFTCKYLTEDFKCGDYKNRPQICREYPDQQLLTKGGILVSKCGYKFIPVENFEDILAKTIDRGDKEENLEN